MNSRDKTEWKIGELLATPRELFVLWVVKSGLCPTLNDFRRHYGADFPAADYVSALEKDGFLDLSSGEMTLTQTGEQALAWFEEPRLPQSHRGKVLLADHNPERAVEVARVLSRHAEFDVETVPSFQRLRFRLERHPAQNDSSLVYIASDLLFDDSISVIKGKTRNRFHPTQFSELLTQHAGTKFCLIPTPGPMEHLFLDSPNLFYSSEIARLYGFSSDFDRVKAKALSEI